jgi:hypothetical protein
MIAANGDEQEAGSPTPEPICPWEPELTKEEIDRRCAKPGKLLSEILNRLLLAPPEHPGSP